jgi:hypothetical protein
MGIRNEEGLHNVNFLRDNPEVPTVGHVEAQGARAIVAVMVDRGVQRHTARLVLRAEGHLIPRLHGL